jgi:hypothetical protein
MRMKQPGQLVTKCGLEPLIETVTSRKSTPSRILFVTSMPASRSNAIGLQTLYFAKALGHNWCHLYWDSGMGESEVPQSHPLSSVILRRWPFKVGRGFLLRQLQRSRLDWWQGNRLLESQKPRLREMLRNTKFAYVAPLRNSEATKCREILETVACPFVVHVWDLSDCALNEDYAWLFSHAERVFCLSSTMVDKMCSTSPCKVSFLTFVRPPSKFRSAFAPAGELKIALIGFLQPYQDGLMLLSSALETFRGDSAKIRLIYIGPPAQLKYMPSPLRHITDYAGFLDDDARDRVLASCHIAYLPGPLLPPGADLRSKHSIPSRMADYLAVGLPVLAAAHPHSATADFFSTIRGRGFFPVADPTDIQCVIRELTNETTWLNAAQECATFYSAHFDPGNALRELATLARRFV